MYKRKIMISAYACEPYKGSEPGVGWNWVLQMSKYYELWVLTRKSNEENINKFINLNKDFESIHFIYFDLPKWVRFWKKGMRGVRTYYTLWQICSNHVVKDVMKKNDIKVFHHLTYGNSLWTVSKYGQKQFFIYGPTGGVDTIPYVFSRNYTFRNRLIEKIRRVAVAMLPWNMGFVDRCKNANVILCKTKYMFECIPKEYQDKALLFTDVAVDMQQNKVKKHNANSKVEFIIVGKFDAWRGFDLAIEAIALLRNLSDKIHLNIIGDGADRHRLEKLVTDLNVEDYVTFLGKVDYDVYHRYMNECDVVLNPALKEGAVTVAFDAMSYAKPIICVDTYGYTNYFKDIAPTITRTTYMDTIRKLAEEMKNMLNPEVRKSVGEKLYQRGLEYTWDTKGEQIHEMIETAIAKWRKD